MDGRAEAAPTGTVVVQLSAPSHLITDGQDVYVTAGGFPGSGEVERIPLDGGEPSRIAAAHNPWGVAVDEAWVYWADEGPTDDGGGLTGQGSIDRVAKVGGAVQTLGTSPEPNEVVVDDTNVYWSDTNVGTNTIWFTPKAGTGSPTLLVTPNAELVGGMALDATYVYWIELDDIPYGALHRIPKGGGTAEAVASVSLAYQFAASDDGGIYAGMGDFGLDGSTGGLLRYDTATGNTRLLGRGGFFPVGVAVDGERAYWTDDLDGVLAAPFDGGAALRLASNVPNASPMGIAVANGVAYWAAFEEGAVRSIAIPADP